MFIVGVEVGVDVGRNVCPFCVGFDVVGNLDGPPVGNDVGLLVVGRDDGIAVGCDDGCVVGDVGWDVDGIAVGCRDGDVDGIAVGCRDGDVDGFNVGIVDGDDDWWGRIEDTTEGVTDSGGSKVGVDDDDDDDDGALVLWDGTLVLRVGDLVGVCVSIRLCIRGSPLRYNGIKLSCLSIDDSFLVLVLSLSLAILLLLLADLNDGIASLASTMSTNDNSIIINLNMF